MSPTVVVGKVLHKEQLTRNSRHLSSLAVISASYPSGSVSDGGISFLVRFARPEQDVNRRMQYRVMKDFRANLDQQGTHAVRISSYMSVSELPLTLLLCS